MYLTILCSKQSNYIMSMVLTGFSEKFFVVVVVVFCFFSVLFSSVFFVYTVLSIFY